MDAGGSSRRLGARLRDLPPTQAELRQRLRALAKRHRVTLRRMSERLGEEPRYLEAWIRSRDDLPLPPENLHFLDRYFGGELLNLPLPAWQQRLKRRR